MLPPLPHDCCCGLPWVTLGPLNAEHIGVGLAGLGRVHATYSCGSGSTCPLSPVGENDLTKTDRQRPDVLPSLLEPFPRIQREPRTLTQHRAIGGGQSSPNSLGFSTPWWTTLSRCPSLTLSSPQLPSGNRSRRRGMAEEWARATRGRPLPAPRPALRGGASCGAPGSRHRPPGSACHMLGDEPGAASRLAQQGSGTWAQEAERGASYPRCRRGLKGLGLWGTSWLLAVGWSGEQVGALKRR